MRHVNQIHGKQKVLVLMYHDVVNLLLIEIGHGLDFIHEKLILGGEALLSQVERGQGECNLARIGLWTLWDGAMGEVK